MEITSDVMLRGADWAKAIEKFGDIFKTRTHYSIYILAMMELKQKVYPVMFYRIMMLES